MIVLVDYPLIIFIVLISINLLINFLKRCKEMLYLILYAYINS